MQLSGMLPAWGTRGVYKGFWWRDLSEREHFEVLVVDGMRILKWIFKKQDRQSRTYWSGPRQELVACVC